ncbi:amino acid ABC transporter substrate-binding protein [Candidatus Saccharibacteria bacterium]|nr:amino acid ABC transporter substrate-binding protein [Candidatus Saccharibacteria bacterium]
MVSGKNKKRKFVIWPVYIVALVIFAILMTVSLVQTITEEQQADYTVQTNAFFAPFEFYEGRKIVGVDIDIINRVAERLGKHIEVTNVEFDVIIDNVEVGRIADAGAAGLTITPARAEKVEFTIPYYNSVQYIIYNRSRPPKIYSGENGFTETEKDVAPNTLPEHTTWEALAGSVLGSQTGGTGYLFAAAEIDEGVLMNTGTTIKGLDSHQLASDAINAHIIDYAIADELAASFIVEKNPDLLAVPLYYSGKDGADDYPVEESYAIAVNRSRTELLSAFNEVLAEMLVPDANGQTEIDKLVLKYMGLAEENY